MAPIDWHRAADGDYAYQQRRWNSVTEHRDALKKKYWPIFVYNALALEIFFFFFRYISFFSFFFIFGFSCFFFCLFFRAMLFMYWVDFSKKKNKKRMGSGRFCVYMSWILYLALASEYVVAPRLHVRTYNIFFFLLFILCFIIFFSARWWPYIGCKKRMINNKYDDRYKNLAHKCKGQLKKFFYIQRQEIYWKNTYII